MIKVFISHSWDTDSLSYELFCKILTEMSDFEWKDLSIPREKPYHVWEEGKLAWEARKDLLEERLPVLEANLREAKNRQTFLALQLNELERSQEYGNTVQDVEQWVSQNASRLEGSVASILERMEELRKRAIKVMTAIKSGRIQYLLEHQEKFRAEQTELPSLIERLQSEIYQTERDLVSFSGSFEDWVRTQTYQCYRDLYEDWEGKTVRRVRPYPKDLMSVISNSIIDADVFVAIAGQFSYYKQWLEYELTVATNYRKPIFLLLPSGQQEVPKELRYVKYNMLQWDKDIIQNAMHGFDVIKSTRITMMNENDREQDSSFRKF